MNKKLLTTFVLVMSIVMITGCSTVRGIFGKNASTEQKQAAKIGQVEDKININTTDKLYKISEFSYGVSYSLNKITNAPVEVISAKELNDRILTLSGIPNISSINEMKILVDNMFTNNYKLLIKKDSEINLLQAENKKLTDQREIELSKYQLLAKNTALKADTTQAELDKWTSWWGLGGIFNGIKMFSSRILLVVVILAVIFIILRFASLSSPFAASIFSIFERIGSWFINIITMLAPKALAKAGAISQIAYDKMALVLRKIVDNVQAIKEIEKKTGKDITFKELLDELSKSMDVEEKQVVNDIKKDLGYNL